MRFKILTKLKTSHFINDLSDLLDGQEVESEKGCPRCGGELTVKMSQVKSEASNGLGTLVQCGDCDFSQKDVLSRQTRTDETSTLVLQGESCPECGSDDAFIGHLMLVGESEALVITIEAQCLMCGHEQIGTKDVSTTNNK